MIRLRKLTDYGFVLLTRFASTDGDIWLTARDLADNTGLPLPTVSKLLKVFSKSGMLTAHRGVHGGYRLARPASLISATDVIEAIDGPLAATECACTDRRGALCAIEEHCPTKPHWVKISKKIRAALSEITLLEMAGSVAVEATDTIDEGCRNGSCKSGAEEPCTCGAHEMEFSGDKV